MFNLLTLIDTALALLGIILIKALATRIRQKYSFPPGPKGLPLIGNILDMPQSHEWVKFAQWGEKYGGIIHLNLLGQHMVILNSAEHAVALLDKRSNIYSDRPRFVVGGEMAGWKNTVVAMPYGNRLRECRRFIAKLIGGHKQVENIYDLQKRESALFLKRVLQNPDDLPAHIKNYGGAIILKLIYGYDIVEGEDPLVNIVEKALSNFSAATGPSSFIFDVFPWLQHVPGWMPGAGLHRQAQTWKRDVEAMADVPFGFVKAKMQNETNIPNFVSGLLETESLEGDRESNIKWSAASMYAAGVDTTVSSIHTLFLIATLYPEVQKRAQEEIDRVVGPDRLPSFEDRPDLPYIDALISELLRWSAVTALGIPHRSVEDDVYEGYFIPKGTIVIANAWRMLHDPSVYPNPEEFDPSRFLPQDQTEMPPDPRNFAFGFGRRICSGLYLADASLFLTCARILAVFHTTKTVENGQIIEPSGEFTSGTNRHPEPFKCTVKPRSAKAEALIGSVDESLLC